MRRSPKVDEVLPILYLRGLSTGGFREAIPALLGDDAAGLSATTITRLTNQWLACAYPCQRFATVLANRCA